MLNSSPDLDERLGERLGREQDRDDRPEEQQPDDGAPLGFRQRPDQLRGPDEVRFLGRRARDAEHVERRRS